MFMKDFPKKHLTEICLKTYMIKLKVIMAYNHLPNVSKVLTALMQNIFNTSAQFLYIFFQCFPISCNSWY